MEILVAKHMGFCGGVKRAVEMAGSAAEAASGDVYTWGPLIHNPQVVTRLQEAGVGVAGALEDLQGEAFVVSAYGVEHAVLDAAQARGMRIVDATCARKRRSEWWKRSTRWSSSGAITAPIPRGSGRSAGRTGYPPSTLRWRMSSSRPGSRVWRGWE